MLHNIICIYICYNRHFVFLVYEYMYIYRVSIKPLYNFKNLLQRQMKKQTSGNYYKMRSICLSFFCLSFNTPTTRIPS